MSPQRIKVLLVDDHVLMREAFEWVSQSSSVELAAYAASGAEAIEALKTKAADVAVIDLVMPGKNGFEIASEVMRMRPGLPIIIYSGMYGHEYVEKAREIGASAYVMKTTMEELISVVRRVVQGEGFIAPSLDTPIRHSPVLHVPSLPLSGKAGLTEREIEVLKLWTQDFEVKEIAEKLGISARTVEAHRASIIHKTGTRSLAALTKLALERGYIEF